MAMVGNRTQIGIKKTGTSVSVPNNDRAKLMYYLNCMTSVLDLTAESALSKLINYEKYYLLDDNEEIALLALCLALNPIELNGKCISAVDDNTINGPNEFLELSSTETNFIASSSVLIGGCQRRVAKIMLYKKSWIQNNYLEPLGRMADKIREDQRRIKEADCCCAIL